MTGSPLQAALLYKILHESVNFIINLCWLTYGICAGRPPVDFSVFEISAGLALFALRLLEFWLDIGIRFGSSSFGIRIGMACLVIVSMIVIGFGGRSESQAAEGQHPTRHLIQEALAN